MSADFESWLDGLGAVEEDHVFMPLGSQSQALTDLYLERATILEETKDGEIVPGERGVGESYSATLDDVDRRIAEQLEQDAPEAPRFRLRGLSDDDYTSVTAEVEEWKKTNQGKTRAEENAEGNIRCIHRAIVVPEGVTLEDVRLLRQKLNRGEWGRLLSHVTRLAEQDAEATSIPN